MKYKWDVFNYSVDADEVGQLFEDIEREKGELTSEKVLEEAKKEESVIHNCFIWDDSIAGEKYRLMQASNMINNLTVVIKTSEETPIKAYVKIKTEDKNNYQHIKTVVEDTNSYNYILNKMEKELENLRKRYEAMLNIEDINSIVEKVFN